MSKNIKQVYDTNPAASFSGTDLIYLGQSPYGPGDDAACLYSTLAAQFPPASGSTSITTLGTVTTGTWNASVISAQYGGTGVNNGANTMTLGGTVNTAGSFTLSGAFAFTGTLTGATNVTFPTSGTLATTSQLPTNPLPLADGGTSKSLVAADGGIVYSDADSMEILAPTATAGKVLQSGSNAAPSWSTPTYPSASGTAGFIVRSDGTNNVYSQSTFADLYAASSILYANGANNVGSIPTANNGLVVTSNTGVPSVLAGPGTTGNFLQSNAAAAPSFSTASFPSTAGTAGNVIISNGTNYVSSTSLWPNTVGSNGKFVISDGTTNGYSTSTIPTSAGATANKVLLSDGTNYVLSTPTFPNASATSGKFIRSDGTNWVASTPTLPTTAGTSGKILQSDGTNYVESTPTYPSASGSAGTILRSNGTNNVYTTSTFADTYTASNLLYSNGANTVTGLATANNSVLVTNGTGVPSLSSTLPSFTTNTITFNPTTAGILGTTTNDNAAAGYVGEFVSSIIALASAISVTSGANFNLTSISLTAGDWIVWGNIATVFAGTGTVSFCWVSSTSATPPDTSLRTQSSFSGVATTVSQIAPQRRFSLSGTTTVYISGQSTFTSTATACGAIYALRVR